MPGRRHASGRRACAAERRNHHARREAARAGQRAPPGKAQAACVRRDRRRAGRKATHDIIVLTDAAGTAVLARGARGPHLRHVDHGEVPEHKVGNHHLLRQRAPRVRQLKVAQSVDRSLDVQREASVVEVGGGRPDVGPADRAEQVPATLLERVLAVRAALAEQRGEQVPLPPPRRRRRNRRRGARQSLVRLVLAPRVLVPPPAALLLRLAVRQLLLVLGEAKPREAETAALLVSPARHRSRLHRALRRGRLGLRCRGTLRLRRGVPRWRDPMDRLPRRHPLRNLVRGSLPAVCERGFLPQDVVLWRRDRCRAWLRLRRHRVGLRRKERHRRQRTSGLWRRRRRHRKRGCPHRRTWARCSDGLANRRLRLLRSGRLCWSCRRRSARHWRRRVARRVRPPRNRRLGRELRIDALGCLSTCHLRGRPWRVAVGHVGALRGGLVRDDGLPRRLRRRRRRWSLHLGPH